MHHEALILRALATNSTMLVRLLMRTRYGPEDDQLLALASQQQLDLIKAATTEAVSVLAAPALSLQQTLPLGRIMRLRKLDDDLCPGHVAHHYAGQLVRIVGYEPKIGLYDPSLTVEMADARRTILWIYPDWLEDPTSGI